MSFDSKLYWNRIGHVEVENAAGRMIAFNGLDFKFKVKSCGDIYQDFSVSILGLSSKTINDLTVWSPAKAVERPRRISVYAGYEGSGEELVATGYIWYAIPTNPPEMWMSFECKKFLVLEENIKEPHTLSDKTLKEVFSSVASEVGLRADFRASDQDKKIPSFEISGRKDTLVRKFSKTFNKTVYDNAGMLVCTDSHGERGEVSRAVRIDSNNGLLSVGNIDMIGARLTTRLRTDIGLCEWIKLTSILIPSASGDYFVIEKELKGHFRGDEWQSEFRCVRKA